MKARKITPKDRSEIEHFAKELGKSFVKDVLEEILKFIVLVARRENK